MIIHGATTTGVNMRWCWSIMYGVMTRWRQTTVIIGTFVALIFVASGSGRQQRSKDSTLMQNDTSDQFNETIWNQTDVTTQLMSTTTSYPERVGCVLVLARMEAHRVCFGLGQWQVNVKETQSLQWDNARDAVSVIALAGNSYMCVTGGWRLGTGAVTDIDVFNYNTMQWTHCVTQLPIARAEPLVVRMRANWLYVCGCHFQHREDRCARTCDVAKVEQTDFRFAWHTIGYPGCADRSISIIDANRFIVFGGQCDNGRVVHLYDVGTTNWRRLQPMDIDRYSHISTYLLTGHVLTCGGRSRDTSILHTCSQFDISASTWERSDVQLPNDQYDGALNLVDLEGMKVLMLVGGKTCNGIAHRRRCRIGSKIRLFNFEAMKWKESEFDLEIFDSEKLAVFPFIVPEAQDNEMTIANNTDSVEESDGFLEQFYS